MVKTQDIMLGQVNKFLVSQVFKVPHIRRNTTSEGCCKSIGKCEVHGNKLKRLPTFMKYNPILEKIIEHNVITINRVSKVTPSAISILSASKSKKILNQDFKSSISVKSKRRLIHTSTLYQSLRSQPENALSVINGIPNEKISNTNKTDINSSVKVLISEVEEFIAYLKEISAKNKPTPRVDNIFATEENKFKTNKNINDTISLKDTKQFIQKDRKPINITIKDLCRINSPQGSNKDLLAASAIQYSKVNTADNIIMKTKTSDDLIDIKTSSPKVQNNVYKFPIMLGKEIPCATVLSKGNFVSGQSKKEALQRRNTKTGEINNNMNIFTKDVQPETSPKESYSPSPDKLSTILKEHKILLETLFDKVNYKSDIRKLQSKDLNRSRNKISNEKFEQIKYEVFKKIWDKYLNSRDKSQERIQRVTSKTGINANFAPNKDTRLEIDSPLELVRNFNGGLSLNRNNKPEGNQLGDIKELTGTERPKRNKNKISFMTSPNKNRHIIKSEKMPFKSQFKFSSSLEDTFRALNLDTPKLVTPQEKYMDATTLKRSQNKMITRNVSLPNIPAAKIMKRCCIRSMSSSCTSQKKESKEKENLLGVFSYSRKTKNNRSNISNLQVTSNTLENDLNQGAQITKCSKSITMQGIFNATALNASNDGNSDSLLKITGEKTNVNDIKGILAKNAVRCYHKASNTYKNIRNTSSDYQLSNKESKYHLKHKSMKDLKKKIMQRNESIRREESKFKFDKRKLIKSQENYTITGNNPIRNEYSDPVKNNWTPNYPKSESKTKTDTESFPTQAASKITPSLTAPTPDNQILQTSAIPVSSYKFKSDSKQSSRLSEYSSEQNKENQESMYDKKITHEQKPAKRNWATISPVSYVDIVSEFRHKKPTLPSKQKQLGKSSQEHKPQEIKKTEEACKSITPEKSNVPGRNWTTISPVTFVDKVLDFRFKKNNSAKQHPVKISSNVASEQVTQKPLEAPAPCMYDVSATPLDLTPEPVEPSLEPIKSKPVQSPFFKDDQSKKIWNEPFRTY